MEMSTSLIAEQSPGGEEGSFDNQQEYLSYIEKIIDGVICQVGESGTDPD